jgi:hypothetical protein
MQDDLTALHAAVARAARAHRRNASPETAAELARVRVTFAAAKLDAAAAEIGDYIGRALDDAPALTSAQREQLAVVFSKSDAP